MRDLDNTFGRSCSISCFDMFPILPQLSTPLEPTPDQAEKLHKEEDTSTKFKADTWYCILSTSTSEEASRWRDIVAFAQVAQAQGATAASHECGSWLLIYNWIQAIVVAAACTVHTRRSTSFAISDQPLHLIVQVIIGALSLSSLFIAFPLRKKRLGV